MENSPGETRFVASEWRLSDVECRSRVSYVACRNGQDARSTADATKRVPPFAAFVFFAAEKTQS